VKTLFGAIAGMAGVCLGVRANAAENSGVHIERHGAGYRIRADKYDAAVAEDGCLVSLRIHGLEFLTARRTNPRGVYVYQNGPQVLSRVARDGANTVSASNDKAEVRYEFGADGIRWHVTNRTAERLLCLIVFDPGVKVVEDAFGEFQKTPVEGDGTVTTWFRNNARLKISGGRRIWGPWSDGLQVWEASVPAGWTHTVLLESGNATVEEQRQAAAALAYAAGPPEDPNGPMWDMTELAKPPGVHPAPGFEADGVRAVFFDGPPYKGRPTRVFAWIGVPEAPSGEKVPGMVLVHGGGGTAFADWVRLWNRRGYAAIAMDTCGCTPGGEHGRRPRHRLGGPPGWGGFAHIDRPRTDQWTYHAVADVILAHSLLRSLPEVDPDRTGITGISWGGYLTSIVAGVDHRFKLAVPVYGCGFTNETVFAARLAALGPERAARWMRWWDPSVYLPNAAMPMLWVTGTNDFAYTFDALQKSYRIPKGPRTLCVRVRMPHGQQAGQSPEEIRLFADSILAGGPPLARITARVREGRAVRVAFHAAVPVVRAELNYTRDRGKWQDRKWETIPAVLDASVQRVTANLPEGTTCWFINLIDARGAVVSTEHEVIRPQPD